MRDPFLVEHGNPTCGSACHRMGWEEYLIESIYPTLNLEIHVSVPPESDLTDYIHAFSHDDQEMVSLNGSIYKWEKITL